MISAICEPLLQFRTADRLREGRARNFAGHAMEGLANAVQWSDYSISYISWLIRQNSVAQMKISPEQTRKLHEIVLCISSDRNCPVIRGSLQQITPVPCGIAALGISPWNAVLDLGQIKQLSSSAFRSRGTGEQENNSPMSKSIFLLLAVANILWYIYTRPYNETVCFTGLRGHVWERNTMHFKNL